MAKKICMLILALALTVSVCTVALAHDVPDLSRKGAISLVMHCGNNAVGGGSLTAYRVGRISEDNGDYFFTLTEDFVASGASLEDIQSSELPARLAEHAESWKCEGITQPVNSQGEVAFTGLELGLYLLVQETVADGYNPIKPVLVSVPSVENGTYVYEIEASPKVEMTKAPEPTEPSEPSEPVDPNLPQTGQLNWPVPVMTVAGLLLIAVGWKLTSHRKKETQ